VEVSAGLSDSRKRSARPRTRSSRWICSSRWQFPADTAGDRQRGIFAAEGRPYPPERLIQPADVAGLVLFLLRLPRTSEVTDIVLRPMQKT
jgi:hypothetical protein